MGSICLAGLLALAGDAKSADSRGPSAAQPSAVTVDLKKASRPPTSVEKQIEKLDPSIDGWDTEAFNDAVAVPLRALTGVIEHPRKVDASALRPFLTGDFGCQALRPEKLKTVYDDGAFRVTRAEDAVEKSLQPSVTDHAGAEGLLAALKQLTDALVDMEALKTRPGAASGSNPRPAARRGSNGSGWNAMKRSISNARAANGSLTAPPRRSGAIVVMSRKFSRASAIGWGASPVWKACPATAITVSPWAT